MTPVYHCTFRYHQNFHLSQLYAGFELLQQLGIASLEVKTGSPLQAPLLEVTVNNNTTILYDLMDGLNWTNGSEQERFAYFKSVATQDHIFKRSYLPRVFRSETFKDLNIEPLGFNYPIDTVSLHKTNLKAHTLNWFRKSRLLAKVFKTHRPVPYHKFEALPVADQDRRVLFQTRLWNPAETENPEWKEHRAKMNARRIECIRRCRKELGALFTGGLAADEFSLKTAPDIVLPDNNTDRFAYLDNIKRYTICIATTGLHNSVGWKMGEYIAASRAIITEPLEYETVGAFNEHHNYESFTNADELLQKIDRLRNDDALLSQQMQNNRNYYLHHLHPAKLILNSLQKALPNIPAPELNVNLAFQTKHARQNATIIA